MSLREQTASTIRRLIKNELRHRVSSAKADTEDQWSLVAFVNETALRHSREDWAKLRSSWEGRDAELASLIVECLREAVADVEDEFREHVSLSWLDKTLSGYLESFRPEDILCK
jgi:hypothetical protein